MCLKDNKTSNFTAMSESSTHSCVCACVWNLSFSPYLSPEHDTTSNDPFCLHSKEDDIEIGNKKVESPCVWVCVESSITKQWYVYATGPLTRFYSIRTRLCRSGYQVSPARTNTHNRGKHTARTRDKHKHTHTQRQQWEYQKKGISHLLVYYTGSFLETNEMQNYCSNKNEMRYALVWLYGV